MSLSSVYLYIKSSDIVLSFLDNAAASFASSWSIVKYASLFSFKSIVVAWFSFLIEARSTTIISCVNIAFSALIVSMISLRLFSRAVLVSRALLNLPSSLFIFAFWLLTWFFNSSIFFQSSVLYASFAVSSLCNAKLYLSVKALTAFLYSAWSFARIFFSSCNWSLYFAIGFSLFLISVSTSHKPCFCASMSSSLSMISDLIFVTTSVCFSTTWSSCSLFALSCVSLSLVSLSFLLTSSYSSIMPKNVSNVPTFASLRSSRICIS